MEPTQDLIDELYVDKVRQARAMSEEQRFQAGPDLFDMACEWTKAGIRMDYPGATDAEVLDLLRRRLALAEKLKVSR
jgi:hypothetical protein